jgi:hypothetical protein
METVKESDERPVRLACEHLPQGHRPLSRQVGEKRVGITGGRSLGPSVRPSAFSRRGFFVRSRLDGPRPVLRRIPVIALTAQAMVGDRDKALEVGCDDFDTKPVELERLLGKIETMLQRNVA